MTKLVLTVLAVDDVQRSAAFYTTAFRWKVTVDALAHVELARPGGMRVGLYRRDSFARNAGVPAATVLDGTVSPAELALRDWGDAAACFADPDGHVVVVARPRPA